jgi:hypothetical protein
MLGAIPAEASRQEGKTKMKPTALSHFANHPWSENERITLIRIGTAFVSRHETKNKREGDKIHFDLWEPQAITSFDADDCLIDKKGSVYARVTAGPNYFPRGAKLKSRYKFLSAKMEFSHHWHSLNRERIEIICHTVFPESRNGYSRRHGGVTILQPPRLTTDDLNDLNASGVPLKPYEGRKVFNPILGTGELVDLNLKTSYGERIKPPFMAVKWRQQCKKCSRRTTVYTATYQFLCNGKCRAIDPKTGYRPTADRSAKDKRLNILCHVHAKK